MDFGKFPIVICFILQKEGSKMPIKVYWNAKQSLGGLPNLFINT